MILYMYWNTNNGVTMERKDFNKAIEILKAYIDAAIVNIDYKASADAPNSYKKMREFKDKNGYFLIYNGGDAGILGAEYNVKFRAVHDEMHYRLKLSFSFKHEKELSAITAREVALWAYDNGYTQFEAYNAYQVVGAEIKGQIEYFEKHGKYIEDQVKYIENYLNVA